MRLLTLITVLFSIMISESVVAQEKLTIATGLKPPLVSSAAHKGFLDTLAVELFRRINIDLEVVVVPAKRALVNANSGVDDGNLLRIKGLEKSYPNLVRVPETIFSSEFIGYSMKQSQLNGDWKMLTDYNVAYVRGWKIFENNVPNRENSIVVGDATQMFNMLKEGHVDVALYEKWQGLFLANKVGLTNVHLLEPPFVRLNMYMYLNKKHKLLIPKVSRELIKMKQDGSYQKIFNQTLGVLLNR